MNVFGLAGWSGSGKTTLLASLLPLFVARGVTVSTVKHAHHGFDVDTPGKDSHRHRSAGATQVLISSARRWALVHELRGAAEWSLERLLARLQPVDLVLVEGFKGEAHDKLEVHRRANGKPFLYPQDRRIKAVAADCRPDGVSPPFFALDDVDGIAAFIAARCALPGFAEGGLVRAG